MAHFHNKRIQQKPMLFSNSVAFLHLLRIAKFATRLRIPSPSI